MMKWQLKPVYFASLDEARGGIFYSSKNETFSYFCWAGFSRTLFSQTESTGSNPAVMFHKFSLAESERAASFAVFTSIVYLSLSQLPSIIELKATCMMLLEVSNPTLFEFHRMRYFDPDPNIQIPNSCVMDLQSVCVCVFQTRLFPAFSS